jgi:hypothetical protein
MAMVVPAAIEEGTFKFWSETTAWTLVGTKKPRNTVNKNKAEYLTHVLMNKVGKVILIKHRFDIFF